MPETTQVDFRVNGGPEAPGKSPAAEVIDEEPKFDGSLISELRADHQARAKKRTTTVPIPGYARLCARYKPISIKKVMEIQERISSDDSDIALSAAADLLIAMCESMVMRTEAGDVDLHQVPEIQRLKDEFGERPIVYDDQLAYIFGIDVDPKGSAARQTVIGVFRAAEPDTGNDIILNDHADNLISWVRTVRREVDTDF